MQSIERADSKLPDYDSSSESSEWSIVANAPLHRYHIEKHHQAGPLISKIFEARKEPTAVEQVERLVETLSVINGEIHDYNVEHNMDRKLGTIDIGVFFYAWDERASDVHLEHFCRLQHYPVDWACRPPVPGSDYFPYRPAYWNTFDWKTPEVLLDAIWKLRLRGTADETVEDVEDTLRIFESKFNREVNRLHRRHESPSPWLNVGHLAVDCLLDIYQELATLIRVGDPGNYARCRENLRRECMLSGYPESWVPGWYEEEKPTSPMSTSCESIMSI